MLLYKAQVIKILPWQMLKYGEDGGIL